MTSTLSALPHAISKLEAALTPPVTVVQHVTSKPQSSVRPAAGWLSTESLADYTRFVAAEVQAGSYPQIEYDANERWHQRLYRDGRVDVWLISWMPSQGTQLHDHGGSAGAFTVVRGCLDEAVHRFDPGQPLLDRRREAGTTVGFSRHYVHDVRNVSAAPAVSVHAYSPPLSAMNYYDVDDAGGLRLIARLETDDPEPDVAPAPRLKR